MRVLIVFAQDKKESLTRTVYNHIVQFLQNQGAQVDCLDLYDHADEIPFYIHDSEKLRENSFFQLNKQLIMQADRVILVFPVYWYAVPGIMKCWIDLITNYAWKFQEGKNKAKALHTIKKVLFVNTNAHSRWYNKFYMGDCINKALKCSFKWMGVHQIFSYELCNVFKLTENSLKTHLKSIEKECLKIIKH